MHASIQGGQDASIETVTLHLYASNQAFITIPSSSNVHELKYSGFVLKFVDATFKQQDGLAIAVNDICYSQTRVYLMFLMWTQSRETSHNCGSVHAGLEECQQSGHVLAIRNCKYKYTSYLCPEAKGLKICLQNQIKKILQMLNVLQHWSSNNECIRNHQSLFSSVFNFLQFRHICLRIGNHG